jgi:phospholipid transport system substrate-binding protein
MRLRQFRLFAFLFLALGIFSASGPAHADTATALIKQFNDALLATMQSAEKLGYTGRYEKLAPVLESTFDMNFMTQYSAGRYWRKLTTEQKKKLVGAFSRLTIATYANRFNGYSGERFRILSEETPREGNRLVNTELVKSDGEPVKLNYLLRETKAGWRVIDIFLKGAISELATKRSEYSSTLGNEGFDGLMAIFEQKINGLNAVKS